MGTTTYPAARLSLVLYSPYKREPLFPSAGHSPSSLPNHRRRPAPFAMRAADSPAHLLQAATTEGCSAGDTGGGGSLQSCQRKDHLDGIVFAWCGA